MNYRNEVRRVSRAAQERDRLHVSIPEGGSSPTRASHREVQRARAGVGDFAQLRRLESILLAYPQSAHTSARSGNGARQDRPPTRTVLHDRGGAHDGQQQNPGCAGLDA